jgi:FkbM family methyltransferase
MPGVARLAFVHDMTAPNGPLGPPEMVQVPEKSAYLAMRGATGRFRRDLRQRLLTPVMLGVRSFREAILNALGARGHLVYCRLPEGNFFVDPSDRVIGSWLMWHGRWQREEIEQAVAVLAQAGRLPDGAVFVDAGANIGTQTVYAMRLGKFARAVAFEPEPRNAELLTMNVAANGLSEKVTIVGKALGASEGEAVLHLHPRNKGAHSIGGAPSLDGTQSVTVPVTRMDGALAALGVAPTQIGMIWIDVEGAEFEVMQGLGDLVGKAPLAIEYSPDRFSSADGVAFRASLKANYKNLHRLGADGGEALGIEALDEIKSIMDILLY